MARTLRWTEAAIQDLAAAADFIARDSPFYAAALVREARAVAQSQLFAVKPTDPETFVLVTVVLAGVAFAANFLPALRATQVDPAVALHGE